ncbi:MAG: HEPN domain-containing protein [Leptolyngbyaceae cyanobacterium SM2_5_2]|nr:HEPN domain-containing protein [Leptolyngbyaceae cyanobacterium SM2_5_2]
MTKAQHDLASARVLSTTNPPLLDTAIYHCQQAAEKAVKGYLAFCDLDIPRTHDIELLLQEATACNPEFSAQSNAGLELTPYAQIYRYPGFSPDPDQEEFARALTLAEEVYDFVSNLLPTEMRPE